MHRTLRIEIVPMIKTNITIRPPKNFLRSALAFVLLSMMIGACAADPASDIDQPEEALVQEAASALTGLGGACNNTCSCQLGLYCELGTCTYDMFGGGPPPPSTACFESCQCSSTQTCIFGTNSTRKYYGACQYAPTYCSSNCDCGRAAVCVNGKCSVDFGPYPECRCNKHCPSGTYCSNGWCQ